MKINYLGFLLLFITCHALASPMFSRFLLIGGYSPPITESTISLTKQSDTVLTAVPITESTDLSTTKPITIPAVEQTISSVSM